VLISKITIGKYYLFNTYLTYTKVFNKYVVRYMSKNISFIDINFMCVHVRNKTMYI